MAREDPQFRIRLPADLKDRVERAAKANMRSLNAEITATLDREYGPRLALTTERQVRLSFDLYMLEALLDVNQFNISTIEREFSASLSGPETGRLNNRLNKLYEDRNDLIAKVDRIRRILNAAADDPEEAEDPLSQPKPGG